MDVIFLHYGLATNFFSFLLYCWQQENKLFSSCCTQWLFVQRKLCSSYISWMLVRNKWRFFHILWVVSRQKKPPSFRNPIKSNQNQIVFTIFWLIWNQTDVPLVLSQSENGKYNPISGWFDNISKRFLRVHGSFLANELPRWGKKWLYFILCETTCK